MKYVLDQLADVSRNDLDLVVGEIKMGQRWQFQQFPRDPAQIVALQMNGAKFRESAGENGGGRELRTN